MKEKARKMTEANKIFDKLFRAKGEGRRPALVVFPGGGYGMLCWSYEGVEVGEFQFALFKVLAVVLEVELCALEVVLACFELLLFFFYGLLLMVDFIKAAEGFVVTLLELVLVGDEVLCAALHVFLVLGLHVEKGFFGFEEFLLLEDFSLLLGLLNDTFGLAFRCEMYDKITYCKAGYDSNDSNDDWGHGI